MGLDEVVEFGALEGFKQVFVGGVFAGDAEVFGDGAEEQEGVLRDEGDLLADLLYGQVPLGDAGEQDFAGTGGRGFLAGGWLRWFFRSRCGRPARRSRRGSGPWRSRARAGRSAPG